MDLRQRLARVVKKDKQQNMKYLNNLIKSDFYYLISNYFEVDFDNIVVDLTLRGDKYAVKLECCGERIKIPQALPD